jgi:hypothetical protein
MTLTVILNKILIETNILPRQKYYHRMIYPCSQLQCQSPYFEDGQQLA